MTPGGTLKMTSRCLRKAPRLALGLATAAIGVIAYEWWVLVTSPGWSFWLSVG
jgi:hypothetical protein